MDQRPKQEKDVSIEQQKLEMQKIKSGIEKCNEMLAAQLMATMRSEGGGSGGSGGASNNVDESAGNQPTAKIIYEKFIAKNNVLLCHLNKSLAELKKDNAEDSGDNDEADSN